MNTQTILIFVMLLLGVVIGCSGSDRDIFPSRDFLVSDVGVRYHEGILQLFETETEVRVLVRLWDKSNITIIGTREERTAQIREIRNLIASNVEKIVPTLPETEVWEIRNRSRGFSASITEDGLNRLIANQDIENIIMERDEDLPYLVNAET